MQCAEGPDSFSARGSRDFSVYLAVATELFLHLFSLELQVRSSEPKPAKKKKCNRMLSALLERQPEGIWADRPSQVKPMLSLCFLIKAACHWQELGPVPGQGLTDQDCIECMLREAWHACRQASFATEKI